MRNLACNLHVSIYIYIYIIFNAFFCSYGIFTVVSLSRRNFRIQS